MKLYSATSEIDVDFIYENGLTSNSILYPSIEKALKYGEGKCIIICHIKRSTFEKCVLDSKGGLVIFDQSPVPILRRGRSYYTIDKQGFKLHGTKT